MEDHIMNLLRHMKSEKEVFAVPRFSTSVASSLVNDALSPGSTRKSRMNEFRPVDLAVTSSVLVIVANPQGLWDGSAKDSSTGYRDNVKKVYACTEKSTRGI